MNFKSIFKRKAKGLSYPVSLSYGSYTGVSERAAMLLSVVYRCVDLISNSIAQLPLQVHTAGKERAKPELEYILNVEPNTVTDRFTLFKMIACSMLLRGNAYLLIERGRGGAVVALHWLNPDDVTIKAEYEGRICKQLYYVVGEAVHESVDIIHIRNYSYDGILGVSTLYHAAQSVQLASDSEATARGFFNGGANLGGVLTVQGMLSEKQKADLKNSWQQAFGVGAGTPKGVAVLEGSMSYQPISVTPSDAQLLESRQYNVIDICRFFGVSPVKAFDLTKSSYSTIEADGIAFLTDTVQPILSKIEGELRRKLLLPSERHLFGIAFDTSGLIRTDKTSLAGYYSSLFQIGVLSQNEIRERLDLPPVEGGDVHYVQVNLGNGANNNTNGNGGSNER